MRLIQAVLLISGAAIAGTDYITLDDLQWKQRIIVAFSNHPDLIESVDDTLTAQKPGIDDRDILYFLYSPAAFYTNSSRPLSLQDAGDLIGDYFENDNELKVILIGKDGGTKLETDRLDPEEIFNLIDSMPMRQREMRQ